MHDFGVTVDNLSATLHRHSDIGASSFAEMTPFNLTQHHFLLVFQLTS